MRRKRLSAAAEAVWGADSVRARCWAAAWRRTLRDGDFGDVLEAIATLPVGTAADPSVAQPVIAETLAYLSARWEQAQYAVFRAQGLPIGSGCVESGHSVVMQARLKGRGMCWAPAHVNPLVALRCALVNGRWADRWTCLTAHWRRALRQRRHARPAHPWKQRMWLPRSGAPSPARL
jgi:hypothetical protein